VGTLSTRLVLLGALLLPGAPARAARPPEVEEAERQAALAEMRDLERRAIALEAQATERNARLKKRLRALYKLSSGGYLRLLSGADSAQEMSARMTGVSRVLERDLGELAALREEARRVDAEHARGSERMAAEIADGDAALSSPDDAPGGLYLQKGKLARPVAGPLVGRFGVQQDHRSAPPLEWSRRGIELRAQPREPVRAVARGRVRLGTERPGYGYLVAVDHGDGWITVTARLGKPRLAAGDPVTQGAILGDAASPTVYFELAHGRTAIDPAAWLSR